MEIINDNYEWCDYNYFSIRIKSWSPPILTMKLFKSLMTVQPF